MTVLLIVPLLKQSFDSKAERLHELVLKLVVLKYVQYLELAFEFIGFRLLIWVNIRGERLHVLSSTLATLTTPHIRPFLCQLFLGVFNFQISQLLAQLSLYVVETEWLRMARIFSDFEVDIDSFCQLGRDNH